MNAVASVLAQTYTNFELCIVDDGSTDGSHELLRELSATDPRVRIVTHAHNQGSCAALNTGIQSTNGEFIAFLDTDDVWLPAKLEKQIERIDRDSTEGAVAVGCGWELMDGRPGRIPTSAPATHREVLKGAPGSGGPTLLVRRLADQPLWNLDLPSMQDRVYLIEYAKHGAVVFVPELLLRVGRGRSDHITKPRATMMAYEEILKLYQAELDPYPDLQAFYHVRVAREALIIGEREKARHSFAAAWRANRVGVGPSVEFILGYLFGYRGLAAYTRLRGAHGYS